MPLPSARNEVSVMRNVKEIAIAAVSLMVICAVVVAALSATNLLTKDIIAAQEVAATNAACSEVMPQGVSFTPLDGDQPFADGVLEVYEASDDSGTVVGYVIKTTTVGKSSGLVVMTGIATDGTVCGVAVVSDNETAGYVDKVKDGGLLERLKGVSGDVSSVDGVSQATKSSNGIKNGVALALTVFGEVSANG